MNKNWFNIKAQTEGNVSSADIYIFDYIGGYGVSARNFINELKQLDVKQINLYISSPGGAVFDGIAIQNSLKHHKANVTVFIDGIAASIASVVALGGDDIRIADNAYVMIHNPTLLVWGDAKEMLKGAEILNKVADGLAGDYSQKMDISIEDALALMNEETWWLGQEAVEAGYADSTFEGTHATAQFDIGRVSAKAPVVVLERFAQSPANNKTNINKEDKIMKKENEQPHTVDSQGEESHGEKSKVVAGEEPPVDVDAAVQTALAEERKRTADITDLGEKFGFGPSAKKFIENGKSVEDFRVHILDKSSEEWKASLELKNPTTQASEQEMQDESEGAAAVAKIKERRAKKFGSN